MTKRIITLPVVISMLVLILGCGYTTGSLLPPEFTSIHVKNFTNAIDVTREVSDRRSNYSYRPGLEVDITRSVIDEFIFDGNLAIKDENTATLTLKGSLLDYRQYAISYDGGDNVEEFRIEILVDLELTNNLTGKVMWEEKNFVGQTNYFVSGPNAKSDAAALDDAVKDIAERIVERTIEAW